MSAIATIATGFPGRLLLALLTPGGAAGDFSITASVVFLLLREARRRLGVASPRRETDVFLRDSTLLSGSTGLRHP